MKTSNIYILFGLLIISALFTSCNDDFLDRTSLDEVPSEVYFTKPKDLETYVNQYYTNAFFPKYANHGSDFDSDDQFFANSIDMRLQGTRTITSTGTINFTTVRSINYFLNNYQRVAENNQLNTYKQYVGEAYYFKAVAYFTLLKNYGDIQWLDKDLGTSSPELYDARTPRNIVVDRILSSLDSAALYMSEDKGTGAGRINKWIALLMQSRIALYEGSWQKYHQGTAFGTANVDPNKYFTIAMQAAKKVMDSGKYAIYSTNNPSSDYRNLFSLRDYTGNPEVMFWRKYDNNLSRGDNGFTNDRNLRMATPSNRTLTKQFADSYLCTDGKPISTSNLFQGYTNLQQEVTNRDPRMRQTIATPDQVWKIQANGATQNWSVVYSLLNQNTDYYAPTGYIIQKGYDPNVAYHVQQFEETPSILFRYAEVLLNYIEAAVELGIATQTDVDLTIKKLRDRAGMPNLVVTNIVTDSNWDFPALSPLINEIRRERRVELVGEGFRWNDIARWAAADELIVGKRPKGFKASQIISQLIPVDENGFLDPLKNSHPNGYGFKLNRDYLQSIPISEIVLNDKLTQNPGWE